MKPRALAILAGAVLAGTPALAQKAAPPDPDSPETHARAVEALARAQRLQINAETRQIVGVNLGVAGKTEDISGLLRDLKAETRGQEVRIELSADVLFDFDKAGLRREAGESLGKVAAVLKANPGARARVEGHTDSRGSDEFNQVLSERRAGSVVNHLQQACRWQPYRMLTPTGMSEADPAASNDSAEGQAQNRRVQVSILVSKAVDGL